MSYFNNVSINFADTASIDSFSRLRVSLPTGLFDAQMTYNLAPLIFESIASGANATVTHNTVNRDALMTFNTTPTGGQAFMQSYEFIPYQPGKSQLAFITFNMEGGVADCLKFAGLSDGINGFEFQLNGTTPQMVLYSNSGNGTQTIVQDNWNIDKLNGTGTSGKVIDFSKVQIFVIDFQALYVGRVRVGFDIDGLVYYVHEFLHSNEIEDPYIQTANLPIRCGMTCTGTVSTTMNFICSSVISEGGASEVRGRGHSIEGSGTAGNNTRAHILSLRPKTTFNSLTNRTKFDLDSVSFLVTGTNPVLFEVVLGQAITGTTTYTDVNTNYSAFEYNNAGTISGSPGLVIYSSYTADTDKASAAAITDVNSRYPITLDLSGAVRSLGTISILATGLGGTSACRALFNWREIR